MQELKTLDLSHNIISELDNIRELKTLEAMTSVDLSHNYIENIDDIVPFFIEL